MHTAAYLIAIYGIELVFLIDLIVNFRFSYINETGDEIYDPKKIAKHYLRHRFFIDLIALIPFDPIAHALHMKFLRMFKLIKVVGILRFDEIINFLNLTKRTKQIIAFVYLVFFQIILVHCVACIWWYIVKGEHNDWIPTIDYTYASTDIYE